VTGANPALADQPPAQEANPVSGALDQLRQTVERIQADSPAAGGTVGHRPPPLAPPPGSAARSSGVLQWAGGRGDEVEIDGSGATSGILTGDALPGVPVLLWIEGENGSIVQLPSRADGYKRLVLHPDSGRVRIHWKILGTGQSR
jgi:hypothetical protein